MKAGSIIRRITSAAAVLLCLASGWLGDARPSRAQPAAELHVKNAAPDSGYLGIVADDREDYGQGVRVLAVRPGGPAEKAGFRSGDLITVVAETRVRGLAAMADVLSPHAAGDTLSFDVLRDGKLLTLKATLGRSPTAPEASPGSRATTFTPDGDTRTEADAAEAPPNGAVVQPQATSTDAQQPPADTQVQIEQLLRRIEQLERRVGQLERALSEMIREERGDMLLFQQHESPEE